ncbi:Bax inhibitor-1/YccA family protein [Candidatus Coxiella mudrowiae]|uniref:Integral membrane protein n=1 Tax=Candidatus Coxiella mudrowiae TaxID=2054173 RepID=A0ABN4HQN3_9COXI|nr:Bax inhibitor-1/YccA family protein [Candidatus Coxiella mudrowiae]AKQ33933.1 Integral membrane protein [Candidatus Coxiella mudrowiae]
MRNSMNTYHQSQRRIQSGSVARFMSKVYLWMVLGLALSASVAYYLFSHGEVFNKVIHTPALFLGLIIAQFAAVIGLTSMNQRLTATIATLIYIFYTVLTGITLSVILFTYTKQNIFDTFAVTSVAFLGLSVFGYTTKRDLGPIGTFCIMGLFGIIGIILLAFLIPSLHSNTMQLTIAAIGVIIFSGLTAYDTQRIEFAYFQTGGAFTESQQRKAAINGALMLYLDFINLFLSLLRLFSRR